MTKEQLTERLQQGPLILDGATGSNLMLAGMPRGVSTELWVLEHRQALIDLQRAYVAAGSQVVYAPTFQANRVSMPDADIPSLIPSLVAVSREAVGGQVLVAGDVSTTGRMAPLGPVTYDELVECYMEAITALKRAGVDYIAAETLMTVEEATAILDAANAVTDLPVVMSMTIEADGGLLFGGNIFDACEQLEAMGAAAVGINCAVGPDQLTSIIRTLRERVTVPIIAKPNAGMPEINDQGVAVYSMGPEVFGQHMVALRDAGASLLGGCCGTSPDYIRAMCQSL
ncbi:MAG TPA: homocysteine S-methyltransferase family protein [Candidatus Avoscillospira avistercoris]|uniref:Homocysteine S-methyltransferase family protein n=1 Tax=Candidatus Avoscillospira avistercoris TaxID=2840707 RepID=A0A9D1F920_9FIRM|nr:homocysteine S-methyltransferase family protein [Candidatus Avoscillospira avistercoris]